MVAVPGCRCEGFAEANQDLFIEKRRDKYFLHDRVVGAGVIYGPEIMHCPFCGNALGGTTALPRAVARK
ncbi:MAG: hypothetical protein ABI591_03500 [Kofleriaceae bacterium]